MRAQCMAFVVALWFVGWARPWATYLDDFACPNGSKMMSWLCIEW